MSRLYEALKEASRRRGSNESGNGLWEYWQKSGIEIPSADTDSDTSQSEPHASTNGYSEETAPEAVSLAKVVSVTEEENAVEEHSSVESDHFIGALEED